MTSLPIVNQPVRGSAALLDQLARRVRLRSESVLAPLGLRPRHLIALTVLRDQESSTQQALSRTLEMDGTNVVGLLNDLEADDLVVRRRSPEDRRRHIVELTAKGRKRLAKAELRLATVEDDVLKSLDHDQRATLHHLLSLAAGGALTCADAAEALKDDSC